MVSDAAWISTSSVTMARAVTCDDFRSAMADANGVDLEQFGRWYEKAGTPEVNAKAEYDSAGGRYCLDVEQSRPGHRREDEIEPLHIPMAVGLLGSDGRDLPLTLEGESEGSGATTRLLELKQGRERFVFTGLPEAPVPSLLRNFSAPVKLKMQLSREELAFLMAHDADAFNRWDAGQRLASQLLLDSARSATDQGEMKMDAAFSDAFGRILADSRLDGSLKALAMTLPAERVLAQEMEVVDPDALHTARQFALRSLASGHREALWDRYASCKSELASAGDPRGREHTLPASSQEHGAGLPVHARGR